MTLNELSPPTAVPGARWRNRKDRSGPPAGAWYPVAFAREVGKSVRLRRRVLGVGIDISATETGELHAATGETAWSVCRHLGLVWVCAQHDLTGVPGLVEDDGFDSRHIVAQTRSVVRTDYDQAVLGLVDPAHVPMIHNAWWWRSAGKRRLKTKVYRPSDYGFTATARDRFVSAPAYKILGDRVEVSIEFRLPSVRVERTVGTRGRILNLTAVTPIGRRGVVLRNVLYSDVAALKPFAPVISGLGRIFLNQDAEILRRFHPSVVGNHPRLFVGDPDRPSLWYYKAKDALVKAQARGEAFVNPVEPAELSWTT